MSAPNFLEVKMKIYRMPDGTKRQYADGEAPDCAVLVTAAEAKPVVVETKAVEPENKAVTPKNKATKGSKKK